jgi:lipopolysaccharide export system permease protein
VRVLLRYVLGELFVPLVLWLAFLFLLLFAMQFLRATEILLGSAVTAGDLGRMNLYLAPHFVVMALPVAFLLAILLGLGRLGEDSEIVAMHSLGIGPLQILAVPLTVGVALGGVMLLMNSNFEPRGMAAVKGLVNEIIKKNVAGDVKPGVFYDDLSQLTVYVERVDEAAGRWENVLLHDDRDPQTPLLVVSQEGRVNPAGQGEAMKLLLTSGDVHRAVRSSRDYTVLSFETAELNVGMEDKIGRKNRFRSPKEEMTPSELRAAAEVAEAEGRSGRPFLMAWWGRLAQGLTPIAFALLGTPLALGSGSGRRGAGRARGFLLTILGYVGYYVVTRLFENLGTEGRVPFEVAAFLPPLLIAGLGTAAMVRLVRGGALR